eukprot:INCI3435.1.p1 GENE.INCI3435.1~~INCI3435.1.p1  ORF type:complete len:233 (-),score=56.78 INCI3435.1:564-1262(-)
MDSESVSSNQTDQSTMSVITSVRYDRSRIAAEAQQLANRIRLLKSEEAKALKRVENTKKRAKELVIAREEMAQSLEERRLAVEHHNRQEALKQEQLQVDRERIKAQILQNRERRVRAKQRDAVRVKQQRAQDLEDLRKRNLEEAERVKIQSLLVREERDERRQKLHKLKIAQEERSREIYSAKLEWEKQRKLAEQRKLEQLEKEEANLLERLRNTQVLQQEAMRTQAMNGLQ